MTKLTEMIKRTFIGTMVCLQVVFYPAAAFAQTDTSTENSNTQSTAPTGETAPAANNNTESAGSETPPPSATQTETPPATESETKETTPAPYTQNEDGSWSNGTYNWDPETKQSSPTKQQEYSYNPETKMWDTVEYAYDPVTGKYAPNVKSVSQKPANGSPVALLNSNGGSGLGLNGINSTGPNSTNLLNSDSANNVFFGGFFNARISNTINSSAHSGNAFVIQNTLGGSALTGDAAVILNLLNLLQSSWDPSMGDINTFVANIDGDVNGDIMIDPGVKVANTGPDSINAANSTSTNDLQVVVDSNGTIDNDLNVDASSGNATVSGNTTGDDARTGNVSAVINLINLINSYINSGSSFFGVLNINGNLNGDILLAPWLLEGLVANTGPNSTNTANNSTTNNLNASISDSQTINNNVNASTTSGEANVAGNTVGGNGTSGEASTNITLLNLTGRKIIGKNALLVFVNVFGKWVGLIMDAPAGTNSALISDTGPGSSNTANTSQTNNADINIANRNTINNDIEVNAASGDASVTGNTQGGDAQSGDAFVGVNIANIINSEFNLSDWFGVLFINVFGSWTGSFGVDTEAGNQPTVQTAVSQPEQPAGNGGGQTNATGTGVFGFIPRLASNFSTSNQNSISGDTEIVNPEVLGEGTESYTTQSGGAIGSENITGGKSNWFIIAAGIMSGLLLLGGEKIAPMLRKRTSGKLAAK